MRKAALAVLAVLVLCPALRAEVMIDTVTWQLVRVEQGRKPVYADITTLPTAPPRIEGKLLARIVLKNRGPQEAEGLVLRYCLTARLAPAGRKEEGVWAVPFLISEKRVPKVGPNRRLEVALDPSESVDMPLLHYLKRTFESGFWPDQLKLQVMLRPRGPDVETVKTWEIILPVNKP